MLLGKNFAFSPPSKKKFSSRFQKNCTQTPSFGTEKSCYLYAFITIYMLISKLISLLTTLWGFKHRAGDKGVSEGGVGCEGEWQRRAERYHSVVTQGHSTLILLLPLLRRGCAAAKAPRLVQAGRSASPFKAYPGAKPRRGEPEEEGQGRGIWFREVPGAAEATCCTR